MPRKKYSAMNTSRAYSDRGPEATAGSRTRRLRTFVEHETGDPQKDGKIWLSRVATTRKQRLERRNGEKDWRRYLTWYEGHQWQDRGQSGGGSLASDNARDTATVNAVGSAVNSMVPFLVNGDIRFLLKARKPSDDVSVMIQQEVLNYEWVERGMDRPLRQCIKDMAIIGHCIAKTGYTIEVDEARELSQDGEINYADYVRKDAPYLERVDPLCFFFDMGGRDNSLHTARWCAEVFFVPFNDVLANKSYDQEVLQFIHGGDYTPTTRTAFDGITDRDPAWMKASRAALPEDNLIVLIEIWDKKFKHRMIFADGVPYPLLVEDWPYDYLDNFPYGMANYIDVPNDCYGIGLARWIEDQQMQLNRIRTGQFNHIRAHQRKFLISPEMDPNEVAKWEDGGDGTGIVGPPNGITPIQDATMSQDFQIVEGRIRADIAEMTGLDALVQGQALPSRTTAGEVGTRTRLFGMKLDAIVDNVETLVVDLGTQVLHHIKKHRTIPDVVKLVGLQGEYWQEYSSEDIQADTDVSVQSFSAPKEDPTILRQQWLQIMQLTVQAMPVLQQTGQIQNLDFGALFGQVLDQFGQKDIGRFWKPALQPRPPLMEGEATPPTAGQGLPPALAGQLAPAPISSSPGMEQPGEGLSLQDMMQQLQGTAAMGGGPRM
jgi:hypothetical protein